MKKIIYKAANRGNADYGWLKTNYSFSFASYYNPDMVHFGMLRVLNDDMIAPGLGFDTHPHDNMEIVTIPLEGSLEHKDSMGHTSVIRAGEVQAMSAGTGIQHSEFNHSKEDWLSLLQIWVFPKERNIKPRYEEKKLVATDMDNQFNTVVAPEQSGKSMWINQDAYFSLGNFDAGSSVEYKIRHAGNGAYLFVIEGSITVDSEKLSKRDAIGISETDGFTIRVDDAAKLLVIDVPMN